MRGPFFLEDTVPSRPRETITFWLALVLVLAVAYLAYRPGLAGGFLFDDYANLPSLGATGPVDNLPAFLRYITSGHADPTGRPLAMLTFLIDGHDWPTDPAPFKRTNLLIHLLNTALLALLLRRLGRERPGSGTARATSIAAVVGAALWGLHPFFVSTTLYIVQREALLPATTVLIGCLCWLQSRGAFARNSNMAGWAWALMAVPVMTVLGTLCKANGLLLPVLLFVLECTVLSRDASKSGAAPAGRRARRWLVDLPTVAIVAWLAYEGIALTIGGVSSIRPWTLPQRLLTEPRVLWDYLDLLWLPRPYTAGVFNDQVTASTGMLQPPTTLLALAALALLVAWAWMYRHKHPVVSAAIGFYIAGHLMESGTIALELYFEHRNYTPALLMFWPVAVWLADGGAMPGRLPIVRPPIRVGLGLLLMAGLACMTFMNASLWGNTGEQALLWARLNPDSPRAQANAAQQEIEMGRGEAAAGRLAALAASRPDDVQVALNMLGAHCVSGGISQADIHAAAWAVGHTRDPGSLLASWFDRATHMAVGRVCPGLDLDVLDRIATSGLANPWLPLARQQDLFHARGALRLARDDAPGALAFFNQAFDKDPRLEAALNQAAALGAAGHPAEALAHLDHAQAGSALPPRPGAGMPMLHQWVLDRQQFWPGEAQRLRLTLIDDLAKRTQ